MGNYLYKSINSIKEFYNEIWYPQNYLDEYFEFYSDKKLNNKLCIEKINITIKTNKIKDGNHLYIEEPRYVLHLSSNNNKYIYIKFKSPLLFYSKVFIDKNTLIKFDETIEYKIIKNKIVFYGKNIEELELLYYIYIHYQNESIYNITPTILKDVNDLEIKEDIDEEGSINF